MHCVSKHTHLHSCLRGRATVLSILTLPCLDSIGFSLQYLTQTPFFLLYFQSTWKCADNTLQFPYMGLNLVGICCSNQDLVHLTIRSDDLQTACFSSTMWPTCITPAAYQTFMCPEILKPFESGYSNDDGGNFNIPFKTRFNVSPLWPRDLITQTV